MKNISIGVINYGMGNHASVIHSLREMGFRVIVTNKTLELDCVDVLLLPGVGAFPAAMKALIELNLVEYLKKQVQRGRPLIGICLGMQLLTSASYEHEYTIGLDLIPGETVPFPSGGGHIGWNTLEMVQNNSVLFPDTKEAFYFNHSFYYHGFSEYEIAMTEHTFSFASIIKRAKVIGLQFHPEKSQLAGKFLLKNLIQNLNYA
ncbi:imidazole glycerol phosphate synthase subunit HisH [Candidatus Methylopumilus planktonicus]|uniref:imidazole glycerol phosphate synthase subunit HisH n=1 Tax=Candidatus Methylopumilus planktonicus TaxID=1581557 RepID=UPI003D189346